ncbi:MAG: hypothetical protein E6J62_20585 [Deltaproteobacteria bacterium]|nr:MAG: hypothetical protein E6J85_15015 [Deltaproteobacteria bacterium]TMB26274.1 MAG: hypothetical protein E6J62_20585 [Deltaproteobacteria bacterium]TMB27669.1 MAG: hypothetical protein E6J61_19560 [Deltaproteobacteria bacterium]
MEKLLFHNFSDGFAGFVLATNAKTKPVAPAAASTTGFGCAPTQDQYGAGAFLVPVDVSGAHGTKLTSTLAGTYARGNGG